MKCSIEGFSQEYALTFKKTIEMSNGKTKTIKLDCTDLVILRWFVDFYPRMTKMTVDGRSYALLTHKKLIDDIPLLDISKRAAAERMQKLVEFGILDYQLKKDGGTFSLYDFGKNYIGFVSKEIVNGCRSNVEGVVGQTTEGAVGQTTYKDKSIIDKSIIDKSINNICPFFENLWKEYPNKKGKNKISKKALKEINSIGEEKMLNAIERYKKSIVGTEAKFIKHGSTFFNGDYVDYLSDEPLEDKITEVYDERYGEML